mmetsp:Transcript_39518/g.86208  ORF Transcript_39518/g.86208 Transcript_39518/m.86208 type:complete len:320 (+) Transcript_39518:374-1333(+)
MKWVSAAVAWVSMESAWGSGRCVTTDVVVASRNTSVGGSSSGARKVTLCFASSRGSWVPVPAAGSTELVRVASAGVAFSASTETGSMGVVVGAPSAAGLVVGASSEAGFSASAGMAFGAVLRFASASSSAAPDDPLAPGASLGVAASSSAPPDPVVGASGSAAQTARGVAWSAPSRVLPCLWGFLAVNGSAGSLVLGSLAVGSLIFAILDINLPIWVFLVGDPACAPWFSATSSIINVGISRPHRSVVAARSPAAAGGAASSSSSCSLASSSCSSASFSCSSQSADPSRMTLGCDPDPSWLQPQGFSSSSSCCFSSARS